MKRVKTQTKTPSRVAAEPETENHQNSICTPRAKLRANLCELCATVFLFYLEREEGIISKNS